MTMTRMRWGLIGARGLAARSCAPAFAEAAGAELIAVLSSDAERARSFAAENGVSTATTELDELLSAPGLEAVWIASPTFLHHRQAKAVLQAGKHVLLEKPLAMTASEAWELVDLARQADVVLATGYQARYVPGHLEMRRLVAEGAIGEVSIARTYYGVHRSGPPPEWRQHRDSAHWGALADIGTHHVDLLRMLLGEVVEAKGLSGHQLGFETDDVDVAAVRFESGVLATVAASTNVWAPHTRVELIGTEGALVAEDTSPNGQGPVMLLTPDAPPRDLSGDRPGAWLRQLEVVTRVASGEDLPFATGEDGARNLEVLEQIAP